MNACTSKPVKEHEQFGFTVRNMIKQQTFNPDTLLSPPSEQIVGLDSTKATTDRERAYWNRKNLKDTVKETDRFKEN